MALTARQIFPSVLLAALLTIAAGKISFAQVPTPTPSPAQGAGQEMPEETLKIETNLVPLNVTVTDRLGRAVTGLRKENFRIYENGVEQQVDFFGPEQTSASWGLVLDRSGSMMEMIQDVYQAALHIIDEGTEQDEMFIVTFNNKTELVKDFTSDRHRLENSILGLRAEGGTALHDAVAFALDHIRHGKHKKKVLMVLTDGEDNMSHLKFRKLVERVEEEGVLIYTVGMVGAMAGGMGGERNARNELTKLAEVTGAMAHFPTNIERCRETMREIAREVSQQYSLGYYPSNKAHDGKWRTIRVMVGGPSGSKYVARTRAGYYAPRGDEIK